MLIGNFFASHLPYQSSPSPPPNTLSKGALYYFSLRGSKSSFPFLSCDKNSTKLCQKIRNPAPISNRFPSEGRAKFSRLIKPAVKVAIHVSTCQRRFIHEDPLTLVGTSHPEFPRSFHFETSALRYKQILLRGQSNRTVRNRECWLSSRHHERP